MDFRTKLVLTPIMLFFALNLFAKDTIVLSTHLKKGRYNYEVTLHIMREAFKRNGLKLVLKPLPGAAALQFAEQGKTDGDAHRIYDLIEKKGLKNLIRVPEIQQIVHDFAWSKQDIKLENGWNDLSSFKVGVLLGNIFVTEKVKKYGKSVIEIVKYEQLFRMLNVDRIDVVIATPSNAAILKSELKGSGIKKIDPPLTSLPIYTYLHKKHKLLVPKIADELHRMKTDGTYLKIIQHLQ